MSLERQGCYNNEVIVFYMKMCKDRLEEFKEPVPLFNSLC